MTTPPTAPRLTAAPWLSQTEGHQSVLEAALEVEVDQHGMDGWSLQVVGRLPVRTIKFAALRSR